MVYNHGGESMSKDFDAAQDNSTASELQTEELEVVDIDDADLENISGGVTIGGATMTHPVTCGAGASIVPDKP
jgi:hypothetical protein